MKKVKMILITGLMITSMAGNVFANQTYINGSVVENTITKDGTIYVPLREVADKLNCEISYDATKNIAYVNETDENGIRVALEIFPSEVKEIEYENGKEIIKVYELLPGQNPSDIPREVFEQDGYTYELKDITKNTYQSRDVQEHVETITVNTKSKDIEDVLKELKPEIEFTSEDGYSGTLKLDISSVVSDVEGYQTSSYTTSEVREYPNLPNADSSLVPKEITVSGKTLKLATINWKSANTQTVDFEALTDNYTAVATYTGTGSRSSVTGYIASANYIGDIAKISTGNDTYTAYFTGTKSVVTIEELKAQIKEIKANEKALDGINWTSIASVLGILTGLAVLAFILLNLKNVKVYSSVDGVYKKVGSTRLKKSNMIIDLNQFSSRVTTPSFSIVINPFTAKHFKDRTVAINYGTNSYQHVIQSEANKAYQFDVSY